MFSVPHCEQATVLQIPFPERLCEEAPDDDLCMTETGGGYVGREAL